MVQLQQVYRFAQQFGKSDDPRRLDAGGEQCAGAPNGTEIDASVSDQRLFYQVVEKALANETPQAVRQECWQEGVHPAGGGWTGGAYHLARPRGRWTNEVNQLAGQFDRKWLLTLDHLKEAGAGQITARQHATGEFDLVAGA